MPTQNDNVHQCQSETNGDIVTFKCTDPECDYVRRFNWRTQKSNASGGRADVTHSGMADPYQLLKFTNN